MNFINIENSSKAYGDKVLFQNISLQISKGEKVALVAKNGTGKTTLFRVLAGKEHAEGELAKVEIRKGIRIGILEQEPEFNLGHTVMEAIFDTDNEMIRAIKNYEEALLNPDDEKQMQAALTQMDDLKAWDYEAYIKELLFKFNINDLTKTVSTLSGGQLKRLALTRILIKDPELLIMDEPTNHLDLDMIEWLEKYLQRPNLTLFMVTHDRYFLDRVCNSIVELSGGQLYKYKGNYEDFLMKKAIRSEVESVELEKTKKLFKKELDWIRRMPKARGTKAKSRVDKFYEIKEKASQRLENDDIKIEIKGQRLGSKILEAEYISKSYDGRKFVDEFFYKFRKGERVGIVGPNGAGKTTFLKLLTKEIRPDSGKVIVGGTVVFGYYTQDGIQLKEDKRVIDVIRDVAEYVPLEKGQKLSAAQMLERFLFNRKQQQVFVSQLSGGEKRRLYLLTILMKNPNFLILDEPTNDLDIITLNILEEFLLGFPGCLIVVSHDRYFMDKIVEHIFVFEGNGKIKDYNGNYTEYRNLAKQRAIEGKRLEKFNKPKEEPSKQKVDENKPARLTYMERKELGRLEKDIEKTEIKKAEIIEKFNDPALDPVEIEKLSVELGNLNKELEEKEMRWLELSERA